MSFIHAFLSDVYDELLHTRKNKYELENWLFMSSPVPVVLLIVGYLYFVLSLGPKLMKNREPFNLNKIMILYNAVQVVLCTYIFIQPFLVKNWAAYTTQPCRTDFGEEFEREYERVGWWVFVSKLLDLLDTVFFVIRKKQSHVTFLHVYHHASMAACVWISIKYIHGQQMVVIMGTNAFVHIIMYSYYLFAVLGPKKYLWWKKHITRLQLGQFIFMLSYTALLIVINCNMSKFLTLITVSNVGIFFYLFLDFYRKTYNKNKITRDQ